MIQYRVKIVAYCTMLAAVLVLSHCFSIKMLTLDIDICTTDWCLCRWDGEPGECDWNLSLVVGWTVVRDACCSRLWARGGEERGKYLLRYDSKQVRMNEWATCLASGRHLQKRMTRKKKEVLERSRKSRWSKPETEQREIQEGIQLKSLSYLRELLKKKVKKYAEWRNGKYPKNKGEHTRPSRRYRNVNLLGWLGGSAPLHKGKYQVMRVPLISRRHKCEILSNLIILSISSSSAFRTT
jgi:hypothetical protein